MFRGLDEGVTTGHLSAIAKGQDKLQTNMLCGDLVGLVPGQSLTPWPGVQPALGLWIAEQESRQNRDQIGLTSVQSHQSEIETLTQCWFNAGPTSATSDQH